MKLNKNIKQLIQNLKRLYPEANCALIHKNPIQLLVATILSAQCTDQRVNLVTKDLFRKYKTANDFSNVGQQTLEKEIRSTGFYRNKAKSIRGATKIISDDYGGTVPDDMESLLKLPGVARKTANVVLGTAYQKSEGVVVDTHVKRLSQRLGLSTQSTPEKIEQDLMKKVDRKDWIWISHALIQHGRQICKAQNPQCHTCPVRKICANPAL